MSQPTSYTGRPYMPPPGKPAPELLVAAFRGHARRLFWSAVVLVAVAGATGYLYGTLRAPLQDWMLLAVGGIVVLLLVVVPYLSWLARSYRITTRRVIARSGVLRAHRRELSHTRGYRIAMRRGPIQRMWGAGTLTLDDGVDEPLRLVNVPNAVLVHEVLVDQVEVSQILAHRDAQSAPPVPPPPPGR